MNGEAADAVGAIGRGAEGAVVTLAVVVGVVAGGAIAIGFSVDVAVGR